jgi:hypothetical protein
MSDRERWIVYPLLFLTLGIALRNQFFPTRRFGAVDLRAGEISAQRILCDELVVRDKAHCREVKFDKAEGGAIQSDRADCHFLNVVNAKGRPLVTAGEETSSGAGLIQTSDSRGMPLVQIRPSSGGGMVTAFGQQGNVLVELGHEERNFGVFVQFPRLGSATFPITPQIRLQIHPVKPPSGPKATPAPKPEEKKGTEKSRDKTP